MVEELADHLVQDPSTAAVSFLVLHGSRARSDATEASDWDFAYLARPGVDHLALHLAISQALGTDRIDLVDLTSASALLRSRVAEHGLVLIEREPEAFLNFRLAASLFWCDVEAVVRAAHADVLTRLG